MGGSVLGTAIIGVAEVLLDNQIPLSVGALAGLLIGAVEGHLIIRRINEGFHETSPAQQPCLRSSRVDLDRFRSAHDTMARRYSRAVFWAALVTALGMTLLVGAILVPSLGLAVAATGCALIAGALLGGFM